MTSERAQPTCRFCGAALRTSMVDLGMSPLCESYLRAEQLNEMEPFYPLHVYACEVCLLVQLEEYVDPGEIFTEYAYFSAYSDSWLDHARRYVEGAIDRFGLGPDNLVIEVGSNDGYLLQYFVQRGVPVLGIDPAANVAEAALARNVPTRVAFFGATTATEVVSEGRRADLVVGNNVLAQVPNINDFVLGVAIVLAPTGVATFEFPHLLRLMDENQFDTIYHEHFSYFSLLAVERIFAKHDLTVFDVEEFPTHGGSLRLYLRHADQDGPPIDPRVDRLREQELAAGLDQMAAYAAFEERVRATKRALLDLLIELKDAGHTIAAYGAAGKGNTLLNYCGIREDYIDYVVDRNPYKQGLYLPGSHIPILHPDHIGATQPDYVLILPWNLRDEIVAQLAGVREWGGKFIVPIPRAEVVS